MLDFVYYWINFLLLWACWSLWVLPLDRSWEQIFGSLVGIHTMLPNVPPRLEVWNLILPLRHPQWKWNLIANWKYDNIYQFRFSKYVHILQHLQRGWWCSPLQCFFLKKWIEKETKNLLLETVSYQRNASVL